MLTLLAAPHLSIRHPRVLRFDDKRRVRAADELFPKYPADEEEILPSGTESIFRDDLRPRHECMLWDMAASRADFELPDEISTDESRSRRDGGSDHGVDYGISDEFDPSLDSRQKYDSENGIDGTNSETDPKLDCRSDHGTDDGIIDELDSSLGSRRGHESEARPHRKSPSRTNARFEHGIVRQPHPITDCKHGRGSDYGNDRRIHTSADSIPERYVDHGTDDDGITYKSKSIINLRSNSESDYGTSNKSLPNVKNRHEHEIDHGIRSNTDPMHELTI